MGKKKREPHSKIRLSETVAGLSEAQQEALCSVFGFPRLYPHQSAAIAAMAGSSDLLLLVRTADGKTEALLGGSLLDLERGLTVMIEPLLALQADMFGRLQKLGLDAILLNSDLSPAAYGRAIAAISENRTSYVLTTPEQLEKGPVFHALNKAGVAAVIVDEVHCLLEYGGDFRPAYDHIGMFIRHLHQRPVVAACTATLAPDSVKKVEKSLSMNHPILIRGPIDRPEIRQNIVEIGSELNRNQADLVAKERFRRLKGAIKDHVGKGDAAIIYCNTIKQTLEVVKELNNKKYHAAAFYGDMPSKEKAKVLQEFHSKSPPIIVATSAFGMGIDKPNVRLIVHMSMPLSMEDYWQKTGRAGRDGKKSYSYVFWYHGDYQTNRQIIGQNAVKLHKLEQLKNFLQSPGCCVQELRSYFGEKPGKRCKHCSRCQNH